MAARDAQPAWADVPNADKRRVLLDFHDAVLDRQAELLDIVWAETGKARTHAFEEVADVALVARHYAIAGAGYLRPKRVPGVLPLVSHAVIERVPRGVVGVVTPWNYPLSLPIGDAIPALFAGNSVVIRPDVRTPATARLGVEMLHAAGVPRAVLQVVEGSGATAGEALVRECDYVCFTGSTATGRRVAAIAGERLVGASLELGGKNSAYVRADADLGRAVEAVVRQAFTGAGQLCMHAERLVLAEPIAAEFVARLVAAVRALRLDDRLGWGGDVGRLIDAAQARRVQAHVDDAVAKGARVVTGGCGRPDLGELIFEPTILAGVRPGMACRDEETFGPVLSVFTVDDDDAAIELINDTEYGLHAAIFSADVPAAMRLARRLRVGTVSINEAYSASWGATAAELGGMKASGLGRRHGAEGIVRFTQAQAITVHRGLGLGRPRGISDRAHARAWTAGLRLLRRLGRS